MGDFYNSIKEVRVTELLDTGAADPSAVPVVSNIPNALTIKPAIIKGDEKEQRGGDVVVCTITEADMFKGVDLELTVASLDFELKHAIAGGNLVLQATEVVGWESSSTFAGMFSLEVWVPHYTTPETDEVEGALDGFLQLTFPFCMGQIGDGDNTDKKFAEDKFVITARSNPSTGDGAIKEEIVEAIT